MLTIIRCKIKLTNKMLTHNFTHWFDMLVQFSKDLKFINYIPYPYDVYIEYLL